MHLNQTLLTTTNPVCPIVATCARTLASTAEVMEEEAIAEGSNYVSAFSDDHSLRFNVGSLLTKDLTIIFQPLKGVKKSS